MYNRHIVLLLPIVLWLSDGIAATRFINVTTSAARNNKSTIECWRLANPFTISGEKGISGTQTASLGHLANGSYSIIPAGYNDGAHNAPVNQYAIFLHGSAEITVPNSSERAIVSAGKNGLVFSADTAALSGNGHITAFIEETVLIQIPVAGGLVPNHTVLHSGGCRGAELVQ